MRFNAPKAAHLYAELAPVVMGDAANVGSNEEKTAALITWLEQQSINTGLPTRLRDCGIREDAVAMLASEAMLQTRLLGNNPREVTEADALAIYQAAY